MIYECIWWFLFLECLANASLEFSLAVSESATDDARSIAESVIWSAIDWEDDLNNDRVLKNDLESRLTSNLSFDCFSFSNIFARYWELDLIELDDIDLIEVNAVRDATAGASETGERKENLFLRRFSIENFYLWGDLIWRYQLISVSSSIASARGVVWLRQCRLSLLVKDVDF
jgi:hypothetical protein